MAISKNDSVSLAQIRARFSEIVQEVKAGAERIITKDGEPYVALIDAERLAHVRRLARECIHLLLIHEARKGRGEYDKAVTLLPKALAGKIQFPGIEEARKILVAG